MADLDERYRHAANGRLGRRQFLVRSLALGAAVPGVGALLTACGGSQSAATTPGAAPATATAVTGGTAPTPAASAATPSTTNRPAGSPMPTISGKQTLIIANSNDIRALDPVQNNDTYSTLVFSQIHDSIALLDRDLNVVPNLAESWESSKDGLTYTYHFRKGVKFHDGSELTADDVVYSIDRIMANKYPEGGKKQKIEMIDTYKKLDDFTVAFTLKFAYAPFAAAVGNQLVVPKAVIEKVGDDAFNKHPIGCGPFKFVDWVTNDHVTLEAFPDYWLTRPRLTQLVVRPVPENASAVANLLAGDVDMINDVVGSNLKQLQGASGQGVTVLTTSGLSYFYLAFRMMKPSFTDVRLRQMVYQSTDFDAVVKAIIPAEIGQRAYSPIPPGIWPQDQDALQGIALKQDKTKAKALLEDMIRDGTMSKDTTLTITFKPDDAISKIGEAIVTNLKEIGANAEIRPAESATFPKMLSGEDNLIYMNGTTPAVPDPDASVRWLFSKDSTVGRYLNLPVYPENAQWDAQINKAEMSQDKDERTQIYRDTVRTMMQQVFHIPLYYKNTIMGSHSYVKEFKPSALVSWDLVKPWANVYIDRGKS